MKKLIVGLLVMINSCFVQALPTAKATILVVDESGVPLEGIDTGLGFSRPKKTGWGSKSAGNRGLTNKEGKFISSGATEEIIRYGARHPDYYTSRYEFTAFTGINGIIGFRKWQPWNPTLKVVLKKIKKPIAMYAYYTDWVEIPKKDGFIGYDLKKHDWVSPYGKGMISDLLVKFEGMYESHLNYDLQLSIKFSNLADGLQKFSSLDSKGSNLISAHHAPLENYKSTLTHNASKAPKTYWKESYSESANYYFRVRCNDKDLESCLYGKIYGDIEFTRKGSLRFKYFLNPTAGDTNVEFDPKRNLFKNLKTTMHEVNQP